MEKELFIFDFDGTLTCKDSLKEFIKFSVGPTGYYAGLLRMSPSLLKYVLGCIPNSIAKESLISHFFKGWDKDFFIVHCTKYSLEKLPNIIRPSALKFINGKKSEGHRIIVVSASMKAWLEPWCFNNGLELISTQLEVVNGKITGRFATKNCYGEEKAKRIREKVDLNLYTNIHVFGDSAGDHEMLALATHSYYKYFK